MHVYGVLDSIYRYIHGMSEQQVTRIHHCTRRAETRQCRRGALSCPGVDLVRQYDLPSYGMEGLEVDYAFVDFHEVLWKEEVRPLDFFSQIGPGQVMPCFGHVLGH